MIVAPVDRHEAVCKGLINRLPAFDQSSQRLLLHFLLTDAVPHAANDDRRKKAPESNRHEAGANIDFFHNVLRMIVLS